MPLSYTALKTFRDCHFRYYLRYDRGLPSRPRPAAQSSRALHGALHLFHQGLKRPAGENALFPPAAISLDTLLRFWYEITSTTGSNHYMFEP